MSRGKYFVDQDNMKHCFLFTCDSFMFNSILRVRRLLQMEKMDAGGRKVSSGSKPWWKKKLASFHYSIPFQTCAFKLTMFQQRRLVRMTILRSGSSVPQIGQTLKVTETSLAQSKAGVESVTQYFKQFHSARD